MTRPEAVDVRHRVLDAIRRYPGIHLRGLERHLGESGPLVVYHVKNLVAHGYVEVRDHGGYSRHFPTTKARTAKIRPDDVPLLSLLREETALHVALILLDDGPQTHTQLLERMGGAKSTLSYHLAKLAEGGLVEREPGTHRVRLQDPDRVYRILLAHAPTPDLLDAFHDLWDSIYGD